MPESHKILPKIEKYLTGNVLEIGCGDQCIVDDAFGVDGRDFPCVDFLTENLYDLPKQMPDWVGHFKTVFSSHTLEHIPDMYRAVSEWSEFCEPGGYFIVYLPDGRYYSNYDNPEHFHNTEYESWVFWFTQTFCGTGKNFKGEYYSKPIFALVEHGLDADKENHYSFFCVAKKL